MDVVKALRKMTDIARRRLMSRSGRGLSAAAIWQLSNYAIPLLTFPYLARVLGVEGFGLIGLAAAIIGYALMVTDWAFGYTGTQAVAQNKDDPSAVKSIVWDVVLAKAWLGSICAGVVFLGAQSAPDGLRIVLMASMLNLVAAVFTVEWALRGAEQLAGFAGVSIIGRLSAVPLIYILVREPGDAAMAATATALGGIVSAGLSWWALARIGLAGRPVLRPKAAWQAARDGSHVFLSIAATSVYTNSIAVALGMVSGTSQVGLYAAAERIKRPVYSLLSPISLVFFPRMSAMSGADPLGAGQLARRLLVIQGGLALFLSIALTASAPLLVKILLGSEFDSSVPVLRVQAWLIFFIGISNVTAAMVMIPFGMKRELSYCILLGGIVGLGSVFPLAYYGGALGASAAALLAEIAVTASSVIMLVRRFSWMRDWKIGSIFANKDPPE